MNKKKLHIAGIGFFLLSLLFLVPGLTYPLISVEIKMNLSQVPLFGSVLGQKELQSKTLSILQVVKELHKQKLLHVALMISFFCVVIPFTKAALMTTGLFLSNHRMGKKLQNIANFLSKWAMADVFVVATLIAFFYMQGFTMIKAHIHEGFYLFFLYVVCSIISAQLMQAARSATEEEE